MADPAPPTDNPIPGSLLTRIVDDMLRTLADHPDVPAPLVTALKTHSDQDLLTSAAALCDALRDATKDLPQ